MSNAAFDCSLTDDVVLVCIPDAQRRQRVTTALREEWAVRTAIDGDAAADSIDDAVSVVVLDGDDVDVSCSLGGAQGSVEFETVGLVADPDDRAVARLDEALRKPVSDETLQATVERRQQRRAYDRLLGQYYTVADRYATKASTPGREPDELAALKERLSTMRRRLDEIADGLSDRDAFDVALDHDDEESVFGDDGALDDK
jgi:hypothetical protein